MAIHEFECTSCREAGKNDRFSLFRSPSKGGDPTICPACGAKCEQVISLTQRNKDGLYSFSGK